MNYFLFNIRTAWDGLLTHKLRSFLTMLGIIFGVTAVISMLAIGAGGEEEILRKISLMGIENIYIYDRPKVRTRHLEERGQYLSLGLNQPDLLAISDILKTERITEAPAVDKELLIQFKQRLFGNKVVGTTRDYFHILNLEAKKGRLLNPDDVDNQKNTAVIGGGLYHTLKRQGKVLGEMIKIAGEWFQIVGVMESKATVAKKDDNLDYEDFNHNIYVPVNVAIFQNPNRYKNLESDLHRLIIRCRDKAKVSKVALIVEQILSRRHKGLRDFKIVIPEELLKQHKETQRIFNIVLGGIAGLSLLVGGIGIMNIMLASILERTKEIGLRRAVGAKKRDIQFQFLMEAVFLTSLGGAFGVILSFIITAVVTFIWGMPTKILFFPCLLSFTIASAVGIIFGYYPARQASRMNPIDALRYE